MGPCIPTPDAAETRPYTFRYSVLPHDNSWDEAATYRHGMQINMPLIAVQRDDKKNNGKDVEHNIQMKDECSQTRELPSAHSFLQISPKNIVLSTLKINEDEKAIIIRFYETEGKKTLAELKFDRKFQSVQITDLLENEIEKEVIHDNHDNKKEHLLRIEVEPFKIVTLKVKF